MKIENEYSFVVDDIESILKYLNKNEYNLVSKSNEIRKIYKGGFNFYARITESNINGKDAIVVDFKEEKLVDSVFNSSKESIPLYISKCDIHKYESIFDVMGLSLDKILVRTRSVYCKENIMFEIDDYSEPEKKFVVAIEGKKWLIDSVYEEIEKII